MKFRQHPKKKKNLTKSSKKNFGNATGGADAKHQVPAPVVGLRLDHVLLSPVHELEGPDPRDAPREVREARGPPWLFVWKFQARGLIAQARYRPTDPSPESDDDSRAHEPSARSSAVTTK